MNLAESHPGQPSRAADAFTSTTRCHPERCEAGAIVPTSRMKELGLGELTSDPTMAGSPDPADTAPPLPTGAIIYGCAHDTEPRPWGGKKVLERYQSSPNNLK